MNQKQVIEQRDFDNWIKDPVTVDIMKSIEIRRDILRDQIAKSYPYTNEAQCRQFVIRGMIDSYNEFLGITYQDFQQTYQEESKNA